LLQIPGLELGLQAFRALYEEVGLDGCMPLPTTNRYVEYISLNICLATHIHEIVLLSIIALLDI
jgi:hypothetical protein